MGQRAFNHASFAGLPCLVKSQWPLMTERITEMMKCNGQRREGGLAAEGWGSGKEEDTGADVRSEWS